MDPALLVQYGSTLLTIALVIGFLMAFGIGANDVANTMATSVGTGAITVKKALIIAAIFEFAGAYLAGGEVTNTIKDNIIDTGAYKGMEFKLALGMISALFASGVWLILASVFGWPVSTTHTIIGSLIGFALVTTDASAVHWSVIAGIFGSWIVTPAISGLIAYLLFVAIQRTIFIRFHPFAKAKSMAPYFIALTFFILSIVTMQNGLKHVGIIISNAESLVLSLVIALISAVAGAVYLRYKKFPSKKERKTRYENVERVFTILLIITACAMAFAHGSNDVANAVGPLAAVAEIVRSGEDGALESAWLLSLGAVGIVIGLATLGYQVMKTIGTNITHLTPSRGFAAQLATATTVVIASGTGLPISTTQTMVGAVMGVGLARGISAINLNVVRKILVSWVVTLPAGAVFAVLFYFIMVQIFC